jgi:DNA-binding protein YbaB
MASAENAKQNLDPDQARRLADAEELRSIVQRASETLASDDHTVTVTVGAGNAITALELQRQAFNHDGRALGRLILETINAANARLNASVQREAAGLAPEGVDLAGLMNGELPSPGAGPDFPGLDFLDSFEVDDDVYEDDVPMPDDWAERPGLDPANDPMRKLQEMEDRLRQQEAAYAAKYEEMAHLKATAKSASDEVTVTAKAGGTVLEIVVDEAAYRHGTTRVAQLVMSTIRAASAQASGALAGELQEIMSGTLDVMALMQPYLSTGDEDEETEAAAKGAGDSRPKDMHQPGRWDV